MPFGKRDEGGMKFIKQRQRLTPVKVRRDRVFPGFQSFDLAFNFQKRISQVFLGLQRRFFLEFFEIFFDLAHGIRWRIAAHEDKDRNQQRDR